MPVKKRKRQSDRLIRISAPELWQFEFVRNDASDAKADWGTVSLGFGLKLNRISVASIDAELSLTVNDSPIIRISASYRAIFEVIIVDAPREEIDRELQLVITNLVASTLYPFLRETFTSAVVKSGLQPLVLPIVDFRAVFPTIELPALDADEETGTETEI